MINRPYNRFSIIFLFLLLYSCINLQAQDINYARFVVDTLSKPGMHGRGYIYGGDSIAADFIRKEFVKAGLRKIRTDFFQPFEIPMNTFPDTIEVIIDGKRLIPGKDYVVLNTSPAVNDTYKLLWFKKDTAGVLQPLQNFGMIDISDKVLVTDLNQYEFVDSNFQAAGIVFLRENKVWWHVSKGYEVKDYLSMQILSPSIPYLADSLKIKVNNHFFEKYKTRNVVGYIPGIKDSSHFMVIGAHYDHLGRMGKNVYFPGANDNASGVAMLLDLARWFPQEENRPDISLVFVAFAGEEAGLHGSFHFVKNPVVPIDNIRFMLNLDMIGSGSKGIKVVNGSIFKKDFAKLQKINHKNEYLVKIEERGEAANSDHYPFYKIGIPSFFIYTLGEECKEYHNIYDTPENVPFTEYEDLFMLIRDFIIEI